MNRKIQYKRPPVIMTGGLDNLVFLFYRDGDLGQHYRDKHQLAAGDFPGSHGFFQQQATEKHGEHRFQAHDQGSCGRLNMLLTDDLQGIGCTHGEEAGLGQREPAIENGIPPGRLCTDHDNAGKPSADSGLNGVHPQRIHICSKMIHEEDLHCEHEGAGDQQ